VLGERILGMLEDCWQQRDADGVIAEPDEETGWSMDNISKVTAKLRYVKELGIRGRHEEAVVVTLTEYEAGMHISLDMVGKEGDENKRLSAVEIVSRFELLRDCWVQLTDGLEVEELVEEAEELGEEVEEIGEELEQLEEEVQELLEELQELEGEGKEFGREGKKLGEEVQELGEWEEVVEEMAGLVEKVRVEETKGEKTEKRGE
jgi:prefoldin subunit 5